MTPDELIEWRDLRYAQLTSMAHVWDNPADERWNGDAPPADQTNDELAKNKALVGGRCPLQGEAMSKTEKLLLRVLRGTSDAQIGFDELCGLLTHLGFEPRVRGSHHMFSKSEVSELINLQRDGGNAKPYQVKQVRAIIVKYKLEI